MVARTHTAGIISEIFFFQKLYFFSIINLTNKVFESISNRPYPLKIISMIFENSAALSPFKIRIKRSMVTLVIRSVLSLNGSSL